MRQLNHTLFVTEEDMELHLRGEALEACRNGIREAHIPLHNVHELGGLLNVQTDCLRFYNLGNHSAEKILHIGAALPEVPAEFIL